MAVPKVPLAPKPLISLKIDGWKSGYKSVDKVLKHLRMKGSGYAHQSYASVESYAEVFNRFCVFSGISDPDKATILPKRQLEEKITAFLHQGIDKNLSRKTIATRRYNLLMHFNQNGRKLDIEKIKIPPRYRKRPEHTPGPEEVLKMSDSAESLRDRAIILCLYTSGIRDATCKALRYKDAKGDLESGAPTTFVPIYPEMKAINHKACKNNIPYYTFFDQIATEALRAYLREREAKYGKMQDEMILFIPSPLQSHLGLEKAAYKPLSKNELSRIIKKAARNAGIPDWQFIHTHSLRYAFEKAIMRRQDGTNTADKDQEFIMGHILPNSQDPYYGSGVVVRDSAVSFDKAGCEYLRKEYSKMAFFPPRYVLSQDDVRVTFKEQFLRMSGLSDKEIGSLGDLSKKTVEELRRVVEERHEKKQGLNGNNQKIVPVEELEEWVGRGWDYKRDLLGGKKVIIGLPEKRA
jgi:integrase